MDHARTRLVAESRQEYQRLASLRHDFDAVVAASRDTNADDEHDPEGATQTEVVLGALATSAPVKA